MHNLFLKILKKELLCEQEQELYPSPDHLLKILLLSSNEDFLQFEPETEGSLKDRVFEVVLQRFETLLPARIFLKDLDPHTFLCPSQLLNAYGALGEFLTLSQTQIGADFPEAGKLVLMGIFIKLYPVFLHDESADLSTLMAELDDILISFKPFVNFFLV